MHWLGSITINYIAYSPNGEAERIEAINIETKSISTIYRQSEPVYIATGVDGGRKLVGVKRTHDTNIQRLPVSDDIWDLKNSKAPAIAPSTRADWRPQVSKDGTQLVFLSARTGSEEFWISGANGENPKQVSKLEGTVEVHAFEWDETNQKIVFDTMSSRIYVLDTATGEDRQLSPENMHTKNPTLTPDGKFAVFTANHDGDWQLWKLPIDGGEAKKITKAGGYSARYSDQGTIILSKYDQLGLWQLDTTTLEEILLVPDVNIDFWKQWTLRKNGIYFTKDFEGKIQLFFHDFSTKDTRRLYDTPHFGYTFDISHDEQTIYFTKDASKGGDIVLIE